ncbi:WD repeat-containing protein 66 [Sciurus carolinensis]|uniref:Cilia- and flagella-associated protein 251 n=1 Tax=Sciurus carolinensis TaxID=30640 RepID=A0AA41NKJ6_SCICA|nr:WD repeat-containing protein 66 [Sciurus carolinensis]
MSDAEENVLEETEESGETEVEEEEYNSNYKEVENMQQKLKDDTLVQRESQEEEEEEEKEKEVEEIEEEEEEGEELEEEEEGEELEEEEEGEELEEEEEGEELEEEEEGEELEEEEGEELEEEEGEELEEEEGEELEEEEEEEEEGEQLEEEEEEEMEEVEEEEEEEKEEEERDKEKEQRKETKEEKGDKGEEEEEEGEDQDEEEEEEEVEEEEPVIKETEDKFGKTEEEAARVQKEVIVLPQDMSIITSEKDLSSSRSSISGTILETQGDKSSLQSDNSETNELFKKLSSRYAFLDLEQIGTEINQPDWQFPEELEEEPGEASQDTVEEKGDLTPKQVATEAERDGRTHVKRVSYGLSDKKEKEFQFKEGVSKESLVSTSTEDSLFQKDESSSVYPLTLTWSFGWNSSLPVFYIRDKTQRVLLYVCAHTAVIYNLFRNSQHHLQGHPNVISCLCVSEDRRWIATADKGPDCLIIIWDSFTGIPVHTIFDSCPEGNGIRAIAMTRDAKYLATISDAEVQKVCIWKWTLAVETPACTLSLPKDYGFQTFNKLVGKFSQSVFHLNLTQILSATMEGKLVVWDVHRPPESSSTLFGFAYIKPCKLVHLQREGITVLTTVDGYLVTGDIRGNIKFYDHTLSIVNWYSHFKLSCIRSLSFSITPASSTEESNFPPDCTLKGDLFVVRNFIIGTSDASVYHVTTDGTKLEKLFIEPKDAICAISCHPYQPLIAIGSFCGMIKVWDYEKKKYLFSRIFEKGLGVQSLTYNPEGALIGAGFTEGTVYILDAMSLGNETPEPFKYSRTSVTHVSFSHDSQYMATADIKFTVAVYMVVVKNGQRVWEYLARLRSHRKCIQSLLFGVHLDSNEPRLLSLGTDRLLIEYNLLKSHKDNLEVLDIHRTDQGNYPTCMVWYPPLVRELFLLICNSGYKMKLFNSTTKMCRKTLLGPTYGSPIKQTQVLPVKTTLDLQRRYLVFINKNKVGLQILPVDGNPHKTCAIVCHPDGVAGMTLSYDGSYAFTAGGRDRSVVQWKINLSALEAAVSLGGEDLTPFYGLVSGGREGKFYRELEDYFYYSQLRSQGIDTMETRKVSEHICLSELPYVMRAIGFYPSEEKIDDMFNEIKFSEYVDTGQLLDKINLPDFFKVYLNHRPPFGNTLNGIQESFKVLGYTNSKGQKAIQREDFLKLLLTKGEHMTEEEMHDCFATLFGLNPEGWKSEPAASSVRGSEICLEEELPDEITAEIFATEILGLSIAEDSG